MSPSPQNISTITLKLRLDADADRALTDVLSKVNEVKGVLPQEANDPVVKRTTGAGFALMYISFNSEQMTPPQIIGLSDRVVQPQLQTINGVAIARKFSAARPSPCASGSTRTRWRRSASRRSTSARRSPPTTSPPPRAR